MTSIYLKQARERKHLTQEQLAVLAQVRQGAISRLETAIGVMPRYDTGLRIAKAVGVDPYRLCFGPDLRLERDR